MADAIVGDDVYREDSTVNELQDECAAAIGKEAGLFVPSGTMANQLGIMLQTRPGEEVLCDESAHLRSIERGAASALSGVAFRQVGSVGGAIQPGDVTTAMETAGSPYPRIGLMAWENTHGASGGSVVPVTTMESTSDTARDHGLAIHLDGARLWNAVAASEVSAARFASAADTVTFCFSKGLGAPIGSILCGDRDLIEEARYLRKRLGGGMRQVGVIAAAARVAFRERERLSEDHELAGELADGLAERFPGSIDPSRVETNIVNVAAAYLPQPIDMAIDHLTRQGIRLARPRLGVLRIVTHRDVDAADVDRMLSGLANP